MLEKIFLVLSVITTMMIFYIYLGFKYSSEQMAKAPISYNCAKEAENILDTETATKHCTSCIAKKVGTEKVYLYIGQCVQGYQLLSSLQDK